MPLPAAGVAAAAPRRLGAAPPQRPLRRRRALGASSFGALLAGAAAAAARLSEPLERRLLVERSDLVQRVLCVAVILAVVETDVRAAVLHQLDDGARTVLAVEHALPHLVALLLQPRRVARLLLELRL